MAEDGLLLNFSIPDTGLLARPTFKGGSWKDRLTARKAAQNWHSRATARLRGEKIVSKADDPATNVNRIDVDTRVARTSTSPQPAPNIERVVKRARVNGNFRSESDEEEEASEFRPRSHLSKAGNAGDNRDTAKRPGKQIVSSLFTFNPISTTRSQANEGHQRDVPVEPSNAPLSSEPDTFTSLGLSASLATHLTKKMELKKPTAVQKAAILQLVKDDSDAFIQAETGSGKTLAYLLPIVHRLVELSGTAKEQKVDEAVQRDSGLFAIIMAPTRELSKQIALVLERVLGCAHWLVATTVIGGEKKKSEKARLRKGINILVATPGRLVDHLQHTTALDVSNVRWLVLDEGDRLMELGFEQDIQKIVSILNLRMRVERDQESKIPGLPQKRTTILCSATMKVDVERLGRISLKDAVHIQVNPTEQRKHTGEIETHQAFFAPAQLKQSYAVVAPKLRLVCLISLLKRAFARKGSVMKAIVFISCADSVDFHFDILTNQLEEDGHSTQTMDENDKAARGMQKKRPRAVLQADPTKLVVTHTESPALSSETHSVTAYRLHGSLQQTLRTSTLAHFTKNKEPSVLIATDVASRGLDLPNVDLVVEFDPAFAREDHLHRIGRTARAGRDGRACVFLMPGCEEGYVEVLKSDRKDSEGGIHVSRQSADDILNRGLVTSGVVDKNAYMEKATDLQLAVERWALASPSRLEAARRAFQSHVRAYATHVADERKYFDIKQLHLGHLAKAFSLRERPGGLNVPGLRTGASRGGKMSDKAHHNGKEGSMREKNKSIVKEPTTAESRDTEEAMKMRSAIRAKEKSMRHAGLASEFNLG